MQAVCGMGIENVTHRISISGMLTRKDYNPVYDKVASFLHRPLCRNDEIGEKWYNLKPEKGIKNEQNLNIQIDHIPEATKEDIIIKNKVNFFLN